jgi:hypothetical protein
VSAADPTDRLEGHLDATASWLLRSIEHGRGGSCAYFSLVGGWSRPYPETSGYLIPSLIGLSRVLRGFDGEERAIALGSWLLQIQDAEGWWHGGLHPPGDEAKPSIFNTAQVLQGLVALDELTGEGRWLEAATRAGRWLAAGVGANGLWAGGDYRASGTPSYYAYAAWPMLEVSARTGDDATQRAAESVLAAILARRRPSGAFAGWGFSEGKPAFTHTIAYTLQGLLESARVLDDWPTYGEPVEAALTELARQAEEAQGRLPGRLDEDWKPAARYVCLTGNAQVALCLLDWERRRPDSRLVAAAALLSDFVCGRQRLRSAVPGLRGAVGGSAPIWGRYMALRYPNWAAKYHCDALVRIIGRSRAKGSS